MLLIVLLIGYVMVVVVIEDCRRNALQYQQISAQNIKLGMGAGFENEFYFYSLRREAGEALNSTLCSDILNLIAIEFW
jgi:hypothetical protein